MKTLLSQNMLAHNSLPSLTEGSLIVRLFWFSKILFPDKNTNSDIFIGIKLKDCTLT